MALRLNARCFSQRMLHSPAKAPHCCCFLLISALDFCLACCKDLIFIPKLNGSLNLFRLDKQRALVISFQQTRLECHLTLKSPSIGPRGRRKPGLTFYNLFFFFFRNFQLFKLCTDRGVHTYISFEMRPYQIRF